MFAAARRIDSVAHLKAQRIVICKGAPAEAMDEVWMWGGRTARLDAVGTLAEALALCMSEPVDKLVVNMFSFTSSELTALMIFRDMRPDQHIVIVGSEEMTPMLREMDLADECHMVPLPGTSRKRAHRVRP